MFADRFHGGPADGEEVPSGGDSLDSDRLVHKASGAVYRRAPELDTDAARAWRVDAEASAPSGAGAGVAGERMMLERREGMTLGQLAEFVDAALARGWSEDAEVRGRGRFGGRLFRVEVR